MKIKLFFMIFLLGLLFSCYEPLSNNIVLNSEAGPKVKRDTLANGELTGASYKTSDGKIIKMTISKISSSNGHHSEIVFLSGNDTTLTLQSGVIRSSESIGRVFTSAYGTGLNYRVDIDASNIFLEEGKSSTGIAGVKVSLNEKTWNGSLDFAKSKFSNLEGAARLTDAIPSQTATVINPFLPVLQDAANFYKSKLSGSGVQLLKAGQPVVLGSDEGNRCRAKCWASFGGLGVLCCGVWVVAGTEVPVYGNVAALLIACPICAVLYGYNASMCADGCPP
jgi:hypothetical protein